MSSKWKKRIHTFLTSEDGPTTVEYSILLAVLVGMIIASVWYVREQTIGVHQDIAEGLTEVEFFN